MGMLDGEQSTEQQDGQDPEGTPGGTSEGTGTDGASPSEDWKAKYEQERQARLAAEGRLKKTVTREDLETLVAPLERKLGRLGSRVDLIVDPDVDDDTRKSKLSELNETDAQAEQREKQSRQDSAWAGKLADRMNRKAARVGLTMEDERLKEVVDLWSKGQQNGIDRDTLEDAHSKLDDIVDEVREERLKETAEERERRERQDAMNQGSNTGGRSGGSVDQDWLDRYADEVNGNIPPTPENRKKAEELMAKGLRPRQRA